MGHWCGHRCGGEFLGISLDIKNERQIYVRQRLGRVRFALIALDVRFLYRAVREDCMHG